MKIVCPTRALQESLRLTVRGIKKNSPIPVLENIRLQTDTDLGLSLAATDYELEIHCTVGCVVEEHGSIMLPAHQLLEIVNSAPTPEVVITSDENHHAQIKSGRSRHKLFGIDPKEFPSLPNMDDPFQLTLSSNLLGDVFSKVIHAISKEACRPAMSAVWFSVEDDKARIASTDSYRLSVYNLAFAGGTENYLSCLVPKCALVEVLHFITSKMEEEIELRFDESHIEFNYGCCRIKSRLISGKFPNIEKLISLTEDHSFAITVDRAVLYEAIKRTEIIARNDMQRFRWEVKGQELLLEAHAKDLGESSEEISIHRDLNTQNIVIWFRSDQLLEALHVFKSPEITFLYKSANSPVLIFGEDEGYYEILMPVVSPNEANPECH